MPQPWATRLGQLAYLPRIAAGHEPTLRTFAEEKLIERLIASGEPLLGIGVGLSERVVEIPWVLGRLSDAAVPLRILDVGTAFAPNVYKRRLVRLPHRLDTVDLAPTNVPGVTSHVGDIRALPFERHRFDVAVCISTLEHIGLDNSQYGLADDDRALGTAPVAADDDSQALAELGRVAHRVLVTVPAGREANMGWQRQYSPASFRRLAERAGLEVERLELFSHDVDRGWMPADESAVAARTYGDGAVAAAAIVCAELRRR